MSAKENQPFYFNDDIELNPVIRDLVDESQPDPELSRLIAQSFLGVKRDTKTQLFIDESETTYFVDPSDSEPIEGIVVKKPKGSNELKVRNDTLIPIEKWEGVVTDFSTESIAANLISVFSGNSTEEVATIPLDWISDEDREYVKKGAVFYWSVGFETFKGQRKRTSMIRFRRLPNFSKTHIQAKQKEFKSKFDGLNWK
ncbi:MAG: hypothetical protein AAF620_18510 [Bacteroidota bacterium]